MTTKLATRINNRGDISRGNIMCVIMDKAVLEETQGYIHGDFWQKKYVYDDVVINNISSVESKDQWVYDLMVKQGAFMRTY